MGKFGHVSKVAGKMTGGRTLKIYKRKEWSMEHNPHFDEEGGNGLQNRKAPIEGLFLNEKRGLSSSGTGREERGEGTKKRASGHEFGTFIPLFLLHYDLDGVWEDSFVSDYRPREMLKLLVRLKVIKTGKMGMKGQLQNILQKTLAFIYFFLSLHSSLSATLQGWNFLEAGMQATW